MPTWSSLSPNQLVDRTALNDAVTNSIFVVQSGQTVPTGTLCVSATECQTWLSLNTSFLPIDGRLPTKQQLVAASGGTVNLNKFDFLVIRYVWGVGAGQDLDTFTGFINTGTIYDNMLVGYGQNGGVMPASRTIPFGATGNTAYLNWGADNTGTSGVEAILLNVQKFVLDNPTANNDIQVRANAVWFVSAGTGNINIQVNTYTGGTMVLSAATFNFINSGGTVVDNISYTKNITLTGQTANITDSTPVAIIHYNKSGGTASLQLL